MYNLGFRVARCCITWTGCAVARCCGPAVNQNQWRTEGGVWGVKPPPKFRSFEKVELDCKLSGKCLEFLFQHPN